MKDINYDFIGNLDADVTMEESYCEKIIEKIVKNPKLGLAGGIIEERIGGKLIIQNITLNSVAGAIQLFRQKCYEDIGGYFLLRSGRIDAAAKIIARMKG